MQISSANTLPGRWPHMKWDIINGVSVVFLLNFSHQQNRIYFSLLTYCSNPLLLDLSQARIMHFIELHIFIEVLKPSQYSLAPGEISTGSKSVHWLYKWNDWCQPVTQYFSVIVIRRVIVEPWRGSSQDLIGSNVVTMQCIKYCHDFDQLISKLKKDQHSVFIIKIKRF